MNALRAAAIAVRSELRSPAWRATALLYLALALFVGSRNQDAAARGDFAYWIVPLATALFLVQTSLARASSAQRGALDFERLYGGGALVRVAVRTVAPCVALLLALALALGALEVSLLWRGAAGAAPRWTERPFAQLARKRLERPGEAASLPAFELHPEDELVLPLRWRGLGAENESVEILVLLRAIGSQEVEEHPHTVSTSLPLRVRAARAGRFDALCAHRGGAGSVRLDLPLARIERSLASHASAAGATLLRLSVFLLALSAFVSGLASWLKPGLCLALVSVALPWTLFDPLQLFDAAARWHPDAGALLELGAWARREPVPIHAASFVPFLVLALAGTALAAFGEARRRMP